MINFYRRIRQNMLSEGKTLKYLKYVIGEIFLVVIGILIALSIHNWNEDQIKSRKAVIYLEQFKNDLENDINTLSTKILSNDNIIKKVDTIALVLMSKKELEREELTAFIGQHEYLVYESYFIPERSTIDQLVGSSQGDLIKNKELRTLLFRYYSTNERNEKNQEISTQLYQHNYITEHITNTILMSYENFVRLGTDNLNRPNIHYSQLSMNTHYISALIRKKRITESQNEQYLKIKSLAENILQVLKIELNQPDE